MADVLAAKPFEAVKAEGIVDATNTDLWERTLTVAGLKFKVDTSTDFGRSQKSKKSMWLEDISPGDYLKVEGFADGQFIVASVIKKAKHKRRTRVTAPVSNVTDTTLMISGIEINTQAHSIRYAVKGKNKSREEFMKAVQVGSFVRVKWRNSNHVDSPPSDVELTH